jgi:hypothetical protein
MFSLFHAVFLLGSVFFDPEDGGDIFLRNVSWVFNGLHCVVSGKIEIFITTSVKTSSPTQIFMLESFWNTRWDSGTVTDELRGVDPYLRT